jgi:hypothetical protein
MAVRPRSLRSLARIMRSRVSADRWPVPTAAGRPAPEVLADPRADELLAAHPRDERLRTHRTGQLLRWRYGYAPLGYRALSRTDDPRDGVAVFRLRRRGPSVEAALCDLLVPVGHPRARRELLRDVGRTSGADYVITAGAPDPRAGYVPLPRHGPTLFAMALASDVDAALLRHWDLCLGDVELL